MTSQKAVSSQGGFSKALSRLSLAHLKAYLRSVRGEVKKIHWTSRVDLLRFTRLVLVSTVLFGFLVYLVDLLVRSGLDLLKAIFKVMG